MVRPGHCWPPSTVGHEVGRLRCRCQETRRDLGQWPTADCHLWPKTSERKQTPLTLIFFKSAHRRRLIGGHVGQCTKKDILCRCQAPTRIDPRCNTCLFYHNHDGSGQKDQSDVLCGCIMDLQSLASGDWPTNPLRCSPKPSSWIKALLHSQGGEGKGKERKWKGTWLAPKRKCWKLAPMLMSQNKLKRCETPCAFK